jgi:hypothetical protein
MNRGGQVQKGDKSEAAADRRREEAGYRAPSSQADDLQTVRPRQMVGAQLVRPCLIEAAKL